jgi:hypothetical protein
MQSNLAPQTQPASNGCIGASSSVISALEVETMRKVSKRLVPFLLIAYLVSVIDRTNIGFAAMQMSHDVGLSQSMFGLAGGIFFVSYFICEVPSNLALERFGARLWLSRIMVPWGLVAGASALVIGPKTFFINLLEEFDVGAHIRLAAPGGDSIGNALNNLVGQFRLHTANHAAELAGVDEQHFTLATCFPFGKGTTGRPGSGC